MSTAVNSRGTAPADLGPPGTTDLTQGRRCITVMGGPSPSSGRSGNGPNWVTRSEFARRVLRQADPALADTSVFIARDSGREFDEAGSPSSRSQHLGLADVGYSDPKGCESGDRGSVLSESGLSAL